MGRYAVDWVEDLYGEAERYRRWARVLGVDIEVDVEEVRVREAEVGHDVAAFLDVVRWQVGRPELGLGLTSSNIVDTAQALEIREATAGLIAEADRVHDACSLLPAIPRAARTHGRLAAPDSMLRQVRSWVSRIERASIAVDRAAYSAGVAHLGGPVGDYSLYDRREAQRTARRLAMPLTAVGEHDQAVSRDLLAAWVEAVARLATAAAHIATQVRLGARDGELREPTGVAAYKGSSSMPHKRNPTRSERVVGIERVVRALAGAVAESVVWWDQRDISHSSVERIAVPQVVGLTAYCLREVAAILRGLEVDAEVVQSNLESTPRSARAYVEAVEAGTAAEEAYRAVQSPSVGGLR